MKSIFSFSSIPSIHSIHSIHSMSSIFPSSKKPLSNANKRRETLNKQITNTIYLCYNEYNKDKKINNFEKILFNELINESKFDKVFYSINNYIDMYRQGQISYNLSDNDIREIFNAIVTGKNTTIKGIIVKTEPSGRRVIIDKEERFIEIMNIKKFSYVNLDSILYLNDIFKNKTSDPCICAAFHRMIAKKIMSINTCAIFINFVNELVENNSVNFEKGDIMNFMNLLETRSQEYKSNIKGVSAISIIEGNRVLKIFKNIYLKSTNKFFNKFFNRAILEIYTSLYLEYFNIDFIPKINKILHINPNMTNNTNIINNTLGFEMNYLGESLDSLIEKNSINEIELIDIIIGLCNNLVILQNIGVIHEDLNIKNVTIIKNGSKIEKVNIIDFGNSVIYRFDNKLINNYSDDQIILFDPRLHFGSPKLKAYDLLGFILSLYQNIKDNIKFNELSEFLKGIYIFNMEDIMKLNIYQIKNIFRIVCMKNEDYEEKFGNYNYKKEYDKITITETKTETKNVLYVNYNDELNLNNDKENYFKYLNSKIKLFYPAEMLNIMNNF